MAETSIYKLWFAQPGTSTADFPLKDMERFDAIESQLLELYTIFGNGVATDRSDKWELLDTVAQADGNPRIYVKPGIGHVYWKVAETTANTAVDLTIPPGIDMTAGLRFYLYAAETPTTHYDRSVQFLPYTSPQADATYIYLCSFILLLGTDGNYTISSVDYTGRDEISIFSTLTKLINTHVHLGGTNPPKINLRLHTSGLLPGDFIEASLSADQITSGKLSLDRLPQIPHASLGNAGDLTHPQIDSLLATLDQTRYGHLSDVATTNLLRTIIMLKAVYLSIDRLLLNTWVYVPGVTSTTKYVDTTYTTAEIDEVNHRIVGIMADPTRSDYVTWSGADELRAAIAAYDYSVNDYPDSLEDSRDTVRRSENVVVLGDPAYDGESIGGLSAIVTVETATPSGASGVPGALTVVAGASGTGVADLTSKFEVLPVVMPSPGTLELETPLSFSGIHSRTGSGSLAWETPSPKVVTTPAGTGNTIPVSGSITVYSLQRFRSNNVAVSQNWSRRNKLQFGIRLVDPSILEHGDIKFHLIGAAHETLPSETLTYTASGSSVTVSLSGGVNILESDEQTAGYDGGILVVTVDLLQFPDRAAVQGFGFSVSSSDGWDLDSYSFTLHQPPYAAMDTAVMEYLREADPYSVGSEGNVTTYVYNDLYRETDGYIIFRMEQPLLTQWDSVDWVTTIPSVPSDVVAPRVTVRTRSAASADLLPYTPWRLVSETTHEIASLPSETIDVIVELTASSDGRYSPVFSSLTLHYTMSSDDNYKTWTTTADFADSLLMQNVAVVAAGNAISLEDSDLVDGMIFLEGNAVNVIDADKVALSSRVIDGSHLYVSPRQVFAKQSSGLRDPRNLTILANGNYLIADTRNDRVVEVDGDGELVRAIQGNTYLPLAPRDFVLLSAIYNSRLGVLYVAFSQNLASNIDRTKFSLATVDGSNSFNFRTDDDGIFEVLAATSGESAVLTITLSTARKQQVDYWTGTKKLTISQGGVVGKAGTTTPSSGGGGGSSTTTPSDPTFVFNSGTGRVTTESTGIAPPVAAVTDETNTFDFDGDGSTQSTTLMDVDGNETIATVLVDDADVVYANIAYPLSAQAVGDNNYVVASAYDPSVINIGIDGEVVWELPESLVSYDSQKLGVATLLSSGTVLCASPALGRVAEIVPSTRAIVYSYTPRYSPYYAVRTGDGTTIIVEVDEDLGGLNSRVFEVDATGDVLREWGLGRLQDPTGVSVLSNGDWLITC